MNYDHILIRFGELSLKKSNRKQFTKVINEHIRNAFKEYPIVQCELRNMRYYIHLNGLDVDIAMGILHKIPGIYSFSPVLKTTNQLDDIKQMTKFLLEQEDYQHLTFKIETNRGDKAYPHTSLEITRMVAGYLFANLEGLKADVHHPDLIINLDVREEGAFIYTKTDYGLGGLPYGSLGKGLLLISGGIDSVVSGYLAIKKGMSLSAIHFSSPPYTSDLAFQKVVDLLEVIAGYTKTGRIKLYNVPFTKIQEQIYEHCQNDYGITIMRRMMYRLSEMIALKEDALALINGESIGQVASQTLESISVINSVIQMPVIRPLATFDKNEIIQISQEIGAFPISIRPYEDCCTVFVPRHPQIKPRLDKAIENENRFDYQPLLKEAIEDAKVINIDCHHHYDVLGQKKWF